ncbi:hypothetical protein EHQ68_14045 [Leptospira congkakensis]|uniref:PA domain-containing protein n=2 Tax=Leptospira congkakensis TaxID=2484932 RepID=A0A4Z1A0H7_9LEPT|nr:hypothetical protein EHQ68_14045 [Leptospira congkakensis]TGL94297.1 hypothetical protein EHQ69_05985 [Leptospira congkakensis]TGL95059.1 hypothetical protein EHQ70_14810 [Leptospira congkakensis]
MLLLFATPASTGEVTQPPGENSPTLNFSYTISEIGAGSAVSISPSSLEPATGITFSVTPTLPTGLSLNSNTGIISGTPTSYTSATDYDIKGQLGSSTKTVRINLGVSRLENGNTAATIASRPVNPYTTYNITAQLEETTPQDACANITNSLAGKVALIKRGTCGYLDKAQRAVTAGAVAIIHYDNSSTDTIPVVNPYTSTINIPSIVISGNSGNALVTALNGGPVNVNLRR